MYSPPIASKNFFAISQSRGFTVFKFELCTLCPRPQKTFFFQNWERRNFFDTFQWKGPCLFGVAELLTQMSQKKICLKKKSIPDDKTWRSNKGLWAWDLSDPHRLSARLQKGIFNSKRDKLFSLKESWLERFFMGISFLVLFLNALTDSKSEIFQRLFLQKSWRIDENDFTRFFRTI